MIAHALEQTVYDLLIGFLALTVLCLIGLLFWIAVCLRNERLAAKRPFPSVDIGPDFEQEVAESLRVVGGSRGPEVRDREAV